MIRRRVLNEEGFVGKTLAIRISEDFHNFLKNECKKRNMTKSHFVSELINFALSKKLKLSQEEIDELN